jgi:beta-glucanase (GH16 family)
MFATTDLRLVSFRAAMAVLLVSVSAAGVGCSSGVVGASTEVNEARPADTSATTASSDDSGGSVATGSESDAGTSTGTMTPPPDQNPPASDDAGAMPPTTPVVTSLADAAPGGAVEDVAGWTLTWSDEFDGADGSAPDPTKWNNEVGGGGNGNNELEYYTPGTQNVVVQGGNLVITATTEGASQYSCWYGQCKYTSARLDTRGKFSQKYGRFEARILSPSGQGMWPAFWTLGENGGWPACGETDIMESIDLVTANHGSLHAPNYNPTATYEPTPGLDQAFHTYAVEWDASAITFFVDDHPYETHTPSDAAKSGGTWAFTQPNFIILNLAIGGNWPGNPDGTTTFPQSLAVDWVRVYSKD